MPVWTRAILSLSGRSPPTARSMFFSLPNGMARATWCRCSRHSLGRCLLDQFLGEMLASVQQKLWDEYLVAEGPRARADKLLALEAFLETLVVSSPIECTEWFPWARAIAKRGDRGVSFDIRRPLFERAVFPALLARRIKR